MLVSSNFFCLIKKLYFIQVNQVELHNSCQKHWSTNSLEEFSFCSASVFLIYKKGKFSVYPSLVRLWDFFFATTKIKGFLIDVSR
jgi:hypothetical protein